jgi:hypothetical protein
MTRAMRLLEPSQQRLIFGIATWGTILLVSATCSGAVPIDFSRTTIVVRPGNLPPAEQMAAQVLVEEVQKRTDFKWTISTSWPEDGSVIAISSITNPPWPKTLPSREAKELPERRAEGYRLRVQRAASTNGLVWISGADSRGTLFGVGQFLRSLHWGKGSARLYDEVDIATAPEQPIRGHQLGYRENANSYDGWDDKQFDQYIRELALFGANSVEGIPFQDERKSPHMPISREIMNRKFSEICARYEMDYWIWTPADFDLNDQAKRTESLEQHEALFRDCPRMDGVFFPGGDPGNNPPELVFPFLEDLSRRLVKHHPKAKIWLSMQGYTKPKVDAVHGWINEKMPDWLGGLAAGPSSPRLSDTRARLPKRYGLRDYPDITHMVRCQYEAVWWDPAFAFTLGRESPNPRPLHFKIIQNYVGPYTSGFISYSDGAHDDVNKMIWTRLAWQPKEEPRGMLLEYTRLFFGPEVAEEAVDGILALEKNWEGALVNNGSVDATLAFWNKLEQKAPHLRDNWRWQLCLLRAYYDAYIRHRQLYESELENEVNQVLAETSPGADAIMERAKTVLERAFRQPIKKEWRMRIDQLCADLFRSIQLQTSVKLYKASGAERGAVLDFVDHPLNNRWWLEDEFARIKKFSTEAEKRQRLELLRTWENPGPGSFYDEVGNIARSPHVIRGEGLNTDPLMERNPTPGFWWWQEGYSRRRLSWQTSLDWPLGLVYERLDPQVSYRVRMTGFGDVKLRLNGQLATPTVYGKEIGEFKEYNVPSSLIQDGKLVIAFDRLNEGHLNWRQQSRVSEVWLLKK